MNIFYFISVIITFSFTSFSAEIKMEKSQAQNAEIIESDYKYGCLFFNARDYKQAFYYFKKAADQNHPGAQYRLGCMYMNDDMIEQNDEEALKYLRLSADQDFVDAQTTIGGMYFKSASTNEHKRIAFEYLSKAAEKNDPIGLYLLGLMFNEWSEKKAIKRFKKSAEKGYKLSHVELEKIYLNYRDQINKLSLVELEAIRNDKYYLNIDNKDRTKLGYWLKIKDTKNGKKLYETGNKLLKEKPEYALDYYLEADSKGSNSAKNTIERLRKKSRDYVKFSDDFSKKDKVLKENKIEWFLALRDYVNKIRDSNNNLAIRSSIVSPNATEHLDKKENSANQKEEEPSNTNQKEKTKKDEQPKVNINTQPEKKCEADNANNIPVINIDNQLKMSGEADKVNNIHKTLNNTNDAAIAAGQIDNIKGVSNQVEVPVVDPPMSHEKKTKTLYFSNPWKKKKENLYSMQQGKTKEEKEEFKRERNKAKVLGNFVDTSEKSCVSKSVAESSQVSKSHLSITESEFDHEESLVSQSEGQMDDIKIYIKNIYPQLFRLIKKTEAERLNQIKILNSNGIRATLKILEAKKLITGTISRANIHVNKVEKQDENFNSHTTHGSGSHDKWYHDENIVVKFFTFISKCDSKIKEYLMSEFGRNCFSRDLEIDDSNGTCSPEAK